MKVYRSLEDFQPLENAFVTQGTFDGVHLGHQKILRQLKNAAEAEGGETVLLTFFPHPRMVLQPDDNSLRLLETVEEKTRHLEELGIDHLLIIPFTKAFSRQTSEAFVRDVLVDAIGTKVLVIGYDHRFGKNREGSFEHLKSLGPTYDFRVEEIAARDIDDVTISSTKIRTALSQGDLETANTYLGYDYRITGTVVHGNRKGTGLGFPTANLQIEEQYKLIPCDGVYAVRVHVRNQLIQGMANIGKQPTFADRKHAFEVHLFDWNEEIYGEQLHVEFVKRLRDEQKFENLDQLKAQLHQDHEHALEALKR